MHIYIIHLITTFQLYYIIKKYIKLVNLTNEIIIDKIHPRWGDFMKKQLIKDKAFNIYNREYFIFRKLTNIAYLKNLGNHPGQPLIVTVIKQTGGANICISTNDMSEENLDNFFKSIEIQTKCIYSFDNILIKYNIPWFDKNNNYIENTPELFSASITDGSSLNEDLNDIKNIIKVYLDIKNSKKVSDITRLPKPYQKVKQQIQSYKMTY